MSLTLLHRLAESPMPAVVCDADEVHLVRVLVDAGYLEASLPLSLWGEPQEAQFAVVTAVRPLGRWVLRSAGVWQVH